MLNPALRDRIDKSNIAREQIALFRVLNVEYFPRESHVVTFRDPYSFPVLFHPECNNLVRQHMEDVAQKVRVLMFPRLPSPESQPGCRRLRRLGRVPDDQILQTSYSDS